MSQELRATTAQAGQCSCRPRCSPTAPERDQAGDSDKFHWQPSDHWGRFKGKSQDQVQSRQQVRPSNDRARGGRTCSMAQPELKPGFWSLGQRLCGCRSQVRLVRAFKGCWCTQGPDSCSDMDQTLTCSWHVLFTM